jgi:predicted transcriptional regulator of viral defense system
MKSHVRRATPGVGPTTAEETVLRRLEHSGVVRPRDLAEEGVTREHFRRLERRGQIVRLARGVYALASADLGEHEGLIAACKLVPSGVVCLLSALRFHELTSQAPFQVWMAVPRSSWAPTAKAVPMRLVWFSGPALEEGVEKHVVHGATVRVYGVAKTVADCFKYRNKIGLDVALEALREVRAKKVTTVDELWHYAAICRVANVMRPYLEAMS